MSQRIRVLQELGQEFERLVTGSADAAAGVGELPPARRRRRGWLRTSIGVVPVLAAVLVPLAVVGAALTLLGRGGHGTPPTPPAGGGIGGLIAHTPQRQLRREVAYIEAATTSVLNTKTCRLKPAPKGVTFVIGSPGADLLSILGVLRRPATPADRLQGLQNLLAGTPDIYRSHVRRAFSSAGTSYYIVPTRTDRAISTPSDRCFALEAAALDRELPKIPASLRQQTRELASAMIAYIRGVVTHAPRDGICLVTAGSNENGGSCGIAAAQIESGEATQDDNGTYIGIVPDGVATVTLTFPASAGHPGRSVTTPVRSNVYAVFVAHDLPLNAHSTPTVIWRTAQGRVLKRIAPPTAADEAALCRREPIACLIAQTATVTQSSSSSGSGTATIARMVSRAG
jgi:hypothetical protein